MQTRLRPVSSCALRAQCCYPCNRIRIHQRHLDSTFGGRNFQITPYLVVKTQAIDIVEIILRLLRLSDVVQTSWRKRNSRCELLASSETHWSTTKSDGMWFFLLTCHIAAIFFLRHSYSPLC